MMSRLSELPLLSKGSTQGTITNIDGEYTLEDVPEKATLTVSYVGYIPASVAVNGKKRNQCSAARRFKDFGRSCCYGYGTVKKEKT